MGILLSCSSVSATVWLHHLELKKCFEKKLDGNYTKMLCVVLNISWKQYPYKTADVGPLTSHLTNHPSKICWEIWVRVDLGVIQWKGTSYSSKLQNWSLTIRWSLASHPDPPMVRETGVQFQVKSYQRLKKWYIMLLYLTLSIIR